MKLLTPSRLLVLIAGLFVVPLFAQENRDIPLRKIMPAKDRIEDAEYGVSLTVPAGWKVTRAFRWGNDFDKTTIVLQPTQSGTRGISLFYQKFGAETQRGADPREWFRSSFQEKEAAKQKELPGYKNDARSLQFGTTKSGLPKCSYLATFTKDSRRLAEYYLRVAGEKTYVMILTQGARADLEALFDDIDRIADSLRRP